MMRSRRVCLLQFIATVSCPKEAAQLEKFKVLRWGSMKKNIPKSEQMEFDTSDMLSAETEVVPLGKQSPYLQHVKNLKARKRTRLSLEVAIALKDRMQALAYQANWPLTKIAEAMLSAGFRAVREQINRGGLL